MSIEVNGSDILYMRPPSYVGCLSYEMAFQKNPLPISSSFHPRAKNNLTNFCEFTITVGQVLSGEMANFEVDGLHDLIFSPHFFHFVSYP